MKLIDQYKRYKIVQCAKCGGLSTTESMKIFQCLRCRKSTQMVKKDSKYGTHLGVKILFSTDNPRECTSVLQEYQKQKINEEYEKEQNGKGI